MLSLTPSTDAASPVPLSTGARTAGLEAQIARYKQQLSDCINCESAKTIEGKAAIEALAAKISATKARVDAIVSAKSSGASAKAESHLNEISRHAVDGGGANATTLTPGQSVAQRYAPTGGLLNVFS